MTIPRKELIDESVPGVYNVTARCVGRGCLGGKGFYTGNGNEHGRVWLRDSLRYLTEAFAIDLLGYSLMGNHIHLIPRNRPDLAKRWSAEEVARRWLRVVSTHQGASQQGARPSDDAVKAITCSPRRVAELRKRLSSISCFMGKLNEYISRRANGEEKLSGRFWEGRFKSSRLGDTAAIVACMIYVDLNPVRAKMAESLEDSDHTSGQDRLVAELARRRVREYNRRKRLGIGRTQRQDTPLVKTRDRPKGDGFWIALNRPSPPLGLFTDSTHPELADWPGRQDRSGKRGVIPEHILPSLESLEGNTQCWVKTVERYGSLFHRLVARAEDMAKAARAKGRKWFQGVGACREFYMNKSQAV